METINLHEEKNKPDLSIIIPVFNEEEILKVLFKRLCDTLGVIQLNYEVIFINDSSTDNSREILNSFHLENNRFKIVSFSRNFGHQIAISAGLDLAKGRAVVIMDADLQDSPETIPQLIKKWQEGYEVVYTIRRKRKENVFKKTAYKIYYLVLRKLANIDIPLDSGDFCLMDQKVVKLIKSMPERTRFVRGLRSWVGFRQIGLEYERDKRFAGKPKYTFNKLIKLASDGIISFSEAPLKIATIIGFIISGLSVLGIIYLIIDKIFHILPQLSGWTSIIVTIAFFGGIQLIVIGLIGEYIIRIFNEVKQRPLYIVNEKIGFDDFDNKAKLDNF